MSMTQGGENTINSELPLPRAARIVEPENN